MKFLDVVRMYGNSCRTMGKLLCCKDEAERMGNTDYLEEIDQLIKETEELQACFEDELAFFYDMALKGFPQSSLLYPRKLQRIR